MTGFRITCSFLTIKKSNFVTVVTIGKATVTSTSVPNNIFAIPFTMHRKKASDALWFAATYGLMPDSLVFSDDSGQLHTIEVNGSSSEGKPIFY